MNNDRFRFRAWFTFDGHEPRMIELDGYYFEPYPIGIVVVDAEDSCHFDGRIPEDCVLMQCTGLHDSEGNLIWEGDLIEIKLDDYRHQEPNISYDDVVTPIVKNICEVRYRLHGGFIALVKNQPYKGKALRLKNKHDKVIGNIYENPELTKQSPPKEAKDE